MNQSKKQEMSAQEEAQWRKAQQQTQHSGIVLTRRKRSTATNAAEQLSK